MSKYIVLLGSDYIRDAQMWDNPAPIDSVEDYRDDEYWIDVEHCNLVLGTIQADSSAQAISAVAKIEKIPGDALSAIQILEEYRTPVCYRDATPEDDR